MSKPRKAWTRGQAERELRSALSDARQLVADLKAHRASQVSLRRSFEDRLIDAVIMRIMADTGRPDSLKLGRPVLKELCRRLLDPAQETMAIHQWLRKQSPVRIGQKSLYRFAHRFRNIAARELEATLALDRMTMPRD